MNKLDFNWDSNVAVGGPIRRDKAWYFTAFELSQFNILVANVFFADGTQADTGGKVKPNGMARLTFQLSERDKMSFAYNNTTSLTERYDFSATTTPEAGLRVNSPLNYSGQLKWTRTATSRLLIEAGQSMAASTYHWEYQPEVGLFEVAKLNAVDGRDEQRLRYCAGRELQPELRHDRERVVRDRFPCLQSWREFHAGQRKNQGGAARRHRPC